jgi:hypothetical protein
MRDRSANRGRTQVIENGERVNRIVDQKNTDKTQVFILIYKVETANGVLNKIWEEIFFDTRIDPIGSINLMGTQRCFKK